jgi:hypothetical protein
MSLNQLWEWQDATKPIRFVDHAGQETGCPVPEKSSRIFLEDGECASRTISYEELDLKAQGLAACLQKMCPQAIASSWPMSLLLTT